MTSRRLVATVLTLVAAVAGVACAGDSSAESADGLPRVDLIEPAVAAVVEELGAEPELLEVAADLDRVDLIVRTDGSNAVLYRYVEGAALEGPIEPRLDDRDTFRPDQIDIEPDRLFDQIASELPDSAVIDFAVHVDGGVVVYDATVASSNGGVLFVLLSGDGQIGGLQAS